MLTPPSGRRYPTRKGGVLAPADGPSDMHLIEEQGDAFRVQDRRRGDLSAYDAVAAVMPRCATLRPRRGAGRGGGSLELAVLRRRQRLSVRRGGGGVPPRREAFRGDGAARSVGGRAREPAGDAWLGYERAAARPVSRRRPGQVGWPL